MKKVIVMTALLLIGGYSAVFAHEDGCEASLRHFTAPGVSLTDMGEKKVFSGSFGKLAVWIEQVADVPTPVYDGWAMSGDKKLPIRLTYEDRKLKGYFNGHEFKFAGLTEDKQGYVFETAAGKAEVPVLFEKRNGRHMVNPLFVVSMGENKKLVRLEGEACMGRSLPYAAFIYGLTLLEQQPDGTAAAAVKEAPKATTAAPQTLADAKERDKKEAEKTAPTGPKAATKTVEPRKPAKLYKQKKSGTTKVTVVYWSGSGNTQKMAQAVAKGAAGKNIEVTLKKVTEISPEEAAKADVLALGCPSMGKEVLQKRDMEPFVAALEKQPGIKGKQLVLFGSYSWGDGKWMRDWQARMQKAGFEVVADGVIIHQTPTKDGLALCEKLGSILVGNK